MSIFGKQFVGLLDSGCNSNIIGNKGWELLKDIGLCKLEKAKLSDVTVANGNICKCIGILRVPVKLVSTEKIIDFLVVPELSHSLILGVDFWTRMGLIPDLRSGEWTFTANEAHVNTIEALKPRSLLTSEQSIILDNLVDNHFKNLKSKLGCTSLVEHKIELVSNTEPIKQRYYPVSPAIMKHIDEELKDMLSNDVIEPSNSPWSSPIVMVRKKNTDSWRFCVDYRLVNRVTKHDAYPLPYISSILDRLRDARYLTSLDIKSAYFQIPVSKESQPLTAFTVPGRGLFHFKRLPFGLSTAPATWQRLIDRVLGVDLEPYCFKYLDDIIITTHTFEQHVDILSKVFLRLNEAGLTLNKEKCQFCRPELQYLGYVVDVHGLHVDPSKVEAILQIPTPSKVADIRRFIGTASWYRRFIPNFSIITKPLTELLRKNVKFHWTDRQEESFRKIKEYLISAPVLSCPDFELSFTIQTDASAYGIAGVLTQNHPTEGEKVICYLSRSLTKQEQKFSCTEREALAVLFCIEKLRPYIEGTHFTVITDHWSLCWLNNLKDPTGRLARWNLKLQQYSFDIIHRKGKDNVVPDMLSRTVPLINTVDTPVQNKLVDRWYERMICKVNENPLRYPIWRVENSKLFRYVESRKIPGITTDNEWKLVAPKYHRKEILRSCHDDPCAGHPGIYKTFKRVVEHYYWPRLGADISRYVRNCRVCSENKYDQSKPAGLMATRHIVDKPFQVVSCDLIGPLPRSKRGYKYILVVVDIFSKFTFAIPLRKATSIPICNAIEEHLFLMFGQPMSLICDNGPQFKSREFKNLLSSYKVRQIFTANYHAQANPTERVNKTLETMIRCYISDNHCEWDKHLPKLSCAIRTQIHESTGYSPYFVVFGNDFPINVSSDTRLAPDFKIDEDALKTDKLQAFQILHADVKRRLERAAEKNKKQYDLRRRDVKYDIGDHVYRKNYVLSDAANHFASKLAPKYVGPFVVSKKISPWMYELQDFNNKICGNWHSKDLKPYHT